MPLCFGVPKRPPRRAAADRARIHAEAIEQTPFKFSSAPSTGVQIQKLDVMLVQKTSWEVEPTNLMQKGCERLVEAASRGQAG